MGKCYDKKIDVRTGSRRFHGSTTGLAIEFRSLGFGIICGMVALQGISPWIHNRGRGHVPLGCAISTRRRVVTLNHGTWMLPLNRAITTGRMEGPTQLLQQLGIDRVRFRLRGRRIQKCHESNDLSLFILLIFQCTLLISF